MPIMVNPAAEASWITTSAIGSLVEQIEATHGLSLSDESRTALYRRLRPLVEPVVRTALEQESAVTV